MKEHCKHQSTAVRRRTFGALTLGAVAIGALGLLASPAAAEYPERSIRYIVPFSPGGGTGITARIIAEKLQEVIGQPVVVENHPGGGTTIGTAILAKADPDGYTVMMTSNSFSTLALLRENLPFDVNTDFAAVGSIARQPFVMTVPPSLGIKTLQEFVDYAKARPGEVNYATAGKGSGSHLASEYFELLAGLEMEDVAYKGAGASFVDHLAGRTDMKISTVISVINHIREGALIPIGVGDPEPLTWFPNVPPINTVVPGFTAFSWNGMLVPAGTPPEIIAKLNEALNTVLNDEEIIKTLSNNGAVPNPSTPQGFADYIEEQKGVWKEVIEKANITVN